MGAMVFTKDAAVVTLASGRRYPINDPPAHNVVVAYSEGRQAYCYDKGVTEQFFYLDFHNMDSVDHDALKSFWQTTVVGPKETFTFTDAGGTGHTVRWMDVQWPLKQVSMGLYSGMITLRKEIS